MGPLLLRERGNARAALYGKRYGSSGLAEGTRPCEGGFVVWERDGGVERGVQGGGLWALVGKGAAGAGAGGGSEGAAAAYGGGMAAQGATRPYLGGLADGAAGVTILVQFDDIHILFSCAEGVGEAGDGVAAIGGLNEGVALLTLWSADGFGPLEVSIGIQLDNIDVLASCAEGFGVAGDGIAAIGGLNEGLALLTRWSADSFTEVGGGAGGRDDGISGRGGSDVRTLRWQRSGDKKR